MVLKRNLPRAHLSPPEADSQGRASCVLPGPLGVLVPTWPCAWLGAAGYCARQRDGSVARWLHGSMTLSLKCSFWRSSNICISAPGRDEEWPSSNVALWIALWTAVLLLIQCNLNPSLATPFAAPGLGQVLLCHLFMSGLMTCSTGVWYFILTCCSSAFGYGWHGLYLVLLA